VSIGTEEIEAQFDLREEEVPVGVVEIRVGRGKG
jgi:hypothetical protein